MAEVKSIDVVAGLLFRDGRLLACQRRADGSFPLEWEFPGGKIEPGEAPALALVRELREELAIESSGVREVFTHTHSYAGFSTVKLKFFHVVHFRGEIVNRVFAQISWVTVDELAGLNFLEGDRPVVEWLTSGNAGELWRGL
jgi:8-oxo-dGTP diphosphatase